MINRQDDIKNYLTNKMSESERQQFEASMSSDEALKKEVAFNKDLMSFFEDENPELEGMLTQLGNEFSYKSTTSTLNQTQTTVIANAKKKYPKSIFWIIGIIVLIAILLISQRINKNSNTSKKSNSTENTTPIENTQETTPIIEQEIESTPQIIPNKEEKQTPTIEESQPMATLEEAYIPNEDLEFLISDGIRSSNLIFELNQPKDFYTFSQKDGKTPIAIDGTISQNIPLEIVIFDNTPRSFNNNRSILKAAMTTESEEDTFRFNFTANTTLSKGLYYFLIYDKNTEEMLAISKFSVK